MSGEKQNVAGYLVYFVLILVVPEMRRPSTLLLVFANITLCRLSDWFFSAG